MANGNIFKHWPTMLLGLAVSAILLIAVFSFQLNETESAVVTTFGRPAQITEPGLHFRWPFPFQKIYRFDHRVRCYEGSSGKLEETMTGDGHNLLVGIYVNFKIKDVVKFFVTFEDVTRAEDQLNSLMRGAKNTAFGLYRVRVDGEVGILILFEQLLGKGCFAGMRCAGNQKYHLDPPYNSYFSNEKIKAYINYIRCQLPKSLICRIKSLICRDVETLDFHL